MFLVFSQLYRHASVSRRSLFIGFTIVSFIVHFALMLLWALNASDFARAQREQHGTTDANSVEMTLLSSSPEQSTETSTAAVPKPSVQAPSAFVPRMPAVKFDAFELTKLQPAVDDGQASKDLAVLVSCGSFSPITYLHLFIFEVSDDEWCT